MSCSPQGRVAGLGTYTRVKVRVNSGSALDAVVLGAWYEHVAAAGAERRAELLATVAPQEAG